MTPRTLRYLALVTATLFLACAASPLAGCRRPSPPAREFAQRFLGDTDEALVKLERHHRDIKQGRARDDIAKSPAFTLVEDAATALRLYEVRRDMYERATAKDKPKGDAATLKKLDLVREAFRGCAFHLLNDVRDALPAYRLNLKYQDTPPAPDAILEGVRADLGIESHTTPPPGACGQYKKLSRELHDSLNIK